MRLASTSVVLTDPASNPSNHACHWAVALCSCNGAAPTGWLLVNSGGDEMKYRSPIRQLLLLLCTLLPSVAVGQVEFLDQNWDANTRQFYYTTSQGSRLMPYDWFLALEVSDGQGSFLRERVTQLGYLANNNLSDNPDRLPVGFVADADWSGEKHIGLNCAACHTNQISYEGKTYQIDGGPALADMWNLLVGIGDSLNATLDQPEKFSRFAASVLGPNPKKRTERRLKRELSEFMEYWNQLIADSTVDHPWGRARLDAFGMIFNRVGSIDLVEPRNNLFFNMARKYEQKVTSSYAKAMTLSAEPTAEREKAGILAYKARPLDGIWATAPYLHNGSIPNLYELVSPVNERSAKFFVGSNEFDPIHVGFQTDEVEGSTLFDTSLPGNRNIGHESYGDFDKQQRWQLVEYMKTL